MIEPPVLVIYAHPLPRHSRINRPLAAALARLPGVTMHDLYARYADYDIDVVAEQRALAMANTVVFQFPVRWYSVPPLLKLWIDEVLEMGWAYGPGGTALRGKSLLVVASAGGSADAYSPQGSHGHEIERFLLPLEQTARLCGMDWLEPLLLLDANAADAATLAGHIDRVSACLGGHARVPGKEAVHESA
ncbi:NAD(P)H dehydrogenase [Cupriavidus sp. USMAA2-4]|uniref:NAD(P)H dehydrogenase n=1 Tax=Cupriavidus malaysiensis TaxID=367825 RepID=A0ABM6EZR5_9BURK|nr:MULTISPECIES: NAD(P)H-dependent oxidoreductase [Cupriavidus]AOY92442.1 NAD(P)H dehydrogenase [Cupriavidus sp. USMAA2-4]AOY97975.1 NAD(P)H dehydrogenase [Cupriavidus sp. USMAHM13]AOZ04403.1 NAD(P)H dehydrogenase [Cupriavidus malaysiensis]